MHTKTDERSDDRLMREAIHLTNDEELTSILMELLDDINKLIPDEDWSVSKELFPLARVARTVEKKLKRKLQVFELESIYNFWAKCVEYYDSCLDLDA